MKKEYPFKILKWLQVNSGRLHSKLKTHSCDLKVHFQMYVHVCYLWFSHFIGIAPSESRDLYYWGSLLSGIYMVNLGGFILVG